MKCTYCEKPEIKERTIIKNDLAWAFPTNIPVVPGHILIAPIRCVAKYEDLTEEEHNAIFDLLQKTKQALKEVFHAEGFNFAWNEGILAGQSISHFHLHVLPRKEGDTGLLGYDPRSMLYRTGDREASSEEELIAIAEKIKKALTDE